MSNITVNVTSFAGNQQAPFDHGGYIIPMDILMSILYEISEDLLKALLKTGLKIIIKELSTL